VDGEFEEDPYFSVKTGRSMDEISDGKTAAEKNKPTRRSGDGLGALIRRYPEVQLATLVDAPPDGAHWLHEITLDGYRLLGFILGSVSRLRTRKGKDWTDHFHPFQLLWKN
jgi:bifunctional non-homologous end joining protein LigD